MNPEDDRSESKRPLTSEEVKFLRDRLKETEEELREREKSSGETKQGNENTAIEKRKTREQIGEIKREV